MGLDMAVCGVLREAESAQRSWVLAWNTHIEISMSSLISAALIGSNSNSYISLVAKPRCI